MANISKFNLPAIERRTIMEALRYHDGNRTYAAAALGISVRTLRNKLHKYGKHRYLLNTRYARNE